VKQILSISKVASILNLPRSRAKKCLNVRATTRTIVAEAERVEGQGSGWDETERAWEQVMKRLVEF